MFPLILKKEKTIVILRALDGPLIDEVIRLSEDYKKSESEYTPSLFLNDGFLFARP